MKRFILSIMLLFVVLFISSCATIGDYTIDGDTVWIEDEDIGLITVTPHTCTEPYCCQEAEMTSYIGTQDLDVAFRFDDPITGDIFRWANISHTANNYSQICDGQIEVESGNDTIWVDNCSYINTPYEEYYFDWQNVNSFMSHTLYQNKHYYITSDVNFVQDKPYNYRWCYNVGFNQDGKWDLLMKRSSDTIQQAYDSGNFIMLDPWWDVDWGHQLPFNITNGQGATIYNISLYLNVSIDDANMMDNYSDLRVADGDNNLLDIDFDFNDSTQVAIWFRDPEMETGVNEYYLYYDNDEAGWVYDADAVFVDAVFIWHGTNATPSIGDTLTTEGTPTYNGDSTMDFDGATDYFSDTLVGIPNGGDEIATVAYGLLDTVDEYNAMFGFGAWPENNHGYGLGSSGTLHPQQIKRSLDWSLDGYLSLNIPVAMAISNEDNHANWDFVAYNSTDVFNETSSNYGSVPDNKELKIGTMYCDNDVDAGGCETFGWNGWIGEVQIYDVDKSLPWLHQMVQNFNASNLVIGEASSLGEGWDNDFTKRKVVSINNTHPEILNNFPVELNITYDNNMQPDFSDLAFYTNETVEVELDFWIKDKIDSNYATVFVELDTIEALGGEYNGLSTGLVDDTSTGAVTPHYGMKFITGNVTANLTKITKVSSATQPNCHLLNSSLDALWSGTWS